MTASKRAIEERYTYKLDMKPYSNEARKVRILADRALQRFGEPTISLDELRSILDKELKGVSLTELILKERAAGW